MLAREPATIEPTAPVSAAISIAAADQKDRRRDGDSLAPGAGTAPPADTAPDQAIIGEFIAGEFGVHKSIRYHAKRRAFFDGLHRLSMALAIIGGSAAFFALTGDKTGIAQFASLIVAIATSLDLVLAFPEKAREHDRLCEMFSDLAADFALIDSAHIDRKRIAELKTKRLTLEKNEPTALDALNVICHNEEAEARGYDASLRYKIGWLQKIVAQFLTLPWFFTMPLNEYNESRIERRRSLRPRRAA